MSRSGNMIWWFRKTYSHKPIKILQFLSRGKIQKWNKFATYNLNCAYNNRFSYVFPVRIAPATLLKKTLCHRCFPVNFAKFLRTPFSQNTSGRLLLDLIISFVILSWLNYFILNSSDLLIQSQSTECYRRKPLKKENHGQ